MSINYTAPTTCAEFMNSPAFIRIIMGPIGSGKTTALIMEILRRAIEQAAGRRRHPPDPLGDRAHHA